jgi:hypothetical protein
MTSATWLSAPFAAVGDLERFGAAYRERIEALLSAQRSMWKDEPGAWVVIPLDRDPAAFALVAADNEGERRGREVVSAFVGSAVGHLDTSTLSLTTSADADILLSDHNIKNVVALHREPGASPAALLESLERLVSVRAGQPPARREAPRALPFLLRDYWLALQQRDAEGSDRILAQIEATSSLSADNLRFLRVDRLASLARWQELADLPTFADLARSRRPRRISEELMEALWTARIETEGGVTSAQHALRRFSEAHLASDFQSLLCSVDVPRPPRARRLAAVSAVIDGTDDRLERILTASSPAEAGFIRDLKNRYPQDHAAVRQRGAAARPDIGELFQIGDWEGVVAGAEERPHDLRAAEVAVRAAFETADATLSRRVLTVLDQLPENELSRSPGFRQMLAVVRASGRNDCASWTEWFERAGKPDRWSQASEVARDKSEDWTISEFSASDIARRSAEALITGSVNANADEVRSSLDLLCALAQRLTLTASGDSLVQAIVLIVSDQDNPSRQVREELRTLIELLLDAGPEASRYADYAGLARDVWLKVQSRAAFDWGLDIADLLAAAPCPDSSARLEFVQTLISWAHRHTQQLDRRQVIVANAVADEVGLATGLVSAEAATGPEDLWARLANARIGLYSLLPRAGTRLQERLARLAPGTRVEQNNDTVATSALRSLAAHSDYMIVDTRHATHSATIAIDSVRPRNSQVLPRGGGVMSYLLALQEQLEAAS